MNRPLIDYQNISAVMIIMFTIYIQTSYFRCLYDLISKLRQCLALKAFPHKIIPLLMWFTFSKIFTFWLKHQTDIISSFFILISRANLSYGWL